MIDKIFLHSGDGHLIFFMIPAAFCALDFVRLTVLSATDIDPAERISSAEACLAGRRSKRSHSDSLSPGRSSRRRK